MNDKLRKELKRKWKRYKMGYESLFDVRDFWWKHWGSKNNLKTIYKEFMNDDEQRYFL